MKAVWTLSPPPQKKIFSRSYLDLQPKTCLVICPSKMAASRRTNPSKESSNSVMQILLDRVKEDPNSSIFFDDICKELNLEPQGEKTMFGKYLKVLFPHVKSRRVCRGTGANRTKCKLFEGIALRTPDELRSTAKREVVELHELVQFVPNSVLVLSSSPVELILGVPTTLFSSGNLVLKIITISNNKWELSISGSAVDLKSKHFQISDDFVADKEGLENLLNVVRKFRVCCGYPVETGREIRDSTCKKLLRERSTFEDHVDVDVLRSWRCERILTFAQYKNSYCRQCFQDCHDLHRNKESEEGSQENKQSSEVDVENLLEPDEDAFTNGPAQMQQFLKCQLDALKCYATYAGKGQKGFPHCWNRTFLSLCVSVWMTSKQAYQILENSGMMILPTVRQLRGYKKKMLAAANPEEILPRLPQRRYQWRRFFSEQAPTEDTESGHGGGADPNSGVVNKVLQGKTLVTEDQQSQETEMNDLGNCTSSPSLPQLKMDCEEVEHDFDKSSSNRFNEHPDENHHHSLNYNATHQKNQGTQTKYTPRSQGKHPQSQEKERAPKRLKTVGDKHPDSAPQVDSHSDKHSEPTEDASGEDDAYHRKPTLLKLSRAIFQFHSQTAGNTVSPTRSATASTSTRATAVATSGAAASVVPVQSAQASNGSYPGPFPVALFPAHGHVHQSICSNPNKPPFTPAAATITRFPVSPLQPHVLAQQSHDSKHTTEPCTLFTENSPDSTVSTSIISASAGTTSSTSITSPPFIKVESPSSPDERHDANL